MNLVALVTGSSRGIGRAVALALARAGWSLLVNYHQNKQAAEATAQECLRAGQAAGKTVEVLTVRADVSDPADRLHLLDQARSRFGRLDLLVNNAGKAPDVRADLLEMNEDSFEQVLNVNLKGPFFLAQQSARWMMELRNTLGADYRPKLVFISSISAYTASVNRGEYCVAKAGIAMTSKLFAVRLAEAGIQVFEIRPGIIRTDMTEPVKEKYDQLIEEGLTPIRRWGTPEDVAKAVLSIAEDRLPFSTGEIVNVDGGFHLRHL